MKKREPRASTEKELEAVVAEAMQRAGTDPAFVYAFRKTGRIVTQQNASQLTDADLKEWEAALNEYHAKVTRKGRKKTRKKKGG